MTKGPNDKAANVVHRIGNRESFGIVPSRTRQELEVLEKLSLLGKVHHQMVHVVCDLGLHGQSEG